MTDRARFEKWCKTLELTLDENKLPTYYDNHYDCDYTDIAYQAWQAATLAERERCAEIAYDWVMHYVVEDTAPISCYDAIRKVNDAS